MSYNGKLKAITIKSGKATIQYTDNIQPAGMDRYISKTKTEQVDHGISERFAGIVRTFLGHGLIRLGLMCSTLDEKAMKSRKCVDMNEFKNFSVVSIKIDGDDENETVKLVLNWETPEGEKVNLNVPPIKINNGGYVYEELILDDLANVTDEANMYLQDKNYFGQQLTMFAGEDSEQF